MSLDPPLEHEPQPDSESQREPTTEEVLAAGYIELRDVENHAGVPARFKVMTEGRGGLVYEDSEGQIGFWFDFNVPPGPVLLSNDSGLRLIKDTREEIAAQRVAKHLQSIGYKVLIHDSNLIDQEALAAATERCRNKMIADGSLTMRVVPQSNPETVNNHNEIGQSGWLKRMLNWMQKP